MGNDARRVAIVGGGVSGLAIAVRLAERGLDVVVLESLHLGDGASTRNQGWLHSGAWFAQTNPKLARACHAAFGHTLAVSPACVASEHDGMLFLVPETESNAWTTAWGEVSIQFVPCPRQLVLDRVSGLSIGERVGFLLPDRSVRFSQLLGDLAQRALQLGADLQTGRTVSRLKVVGNRVEGVETADGETIAADYVVLAGNARGMQLLRETIASGPGRQPPVKWVALKTHLASTTTDVDRWPFCVVDADGVHHVRHARQSVFGVSRWTPVSDPLDQSPIPKEQTLLLERIAELLPTMGDVSWELRAGTTIQAMHDEQIVPGAAPLPTVLDHSTFEPRLENLVSVFPGRASLWHRVAEEVDEWIGRRQ